MRDRQKGPLSHFWHVFDTWVGARRDSGYRWEGAIEDDTGIRVALHIRTSLVPAFIGRIKKDHPYDVPCILAFTVDDANPDYVAWVERGAREAA